MTTRVIRINNDGVFLNATHVIAFTKTNLPINDFSFTGDHYWEVKIEQPVGKDQVKIHSEELHLEVVNYHANYQARFNVQVVKKDIPFLVFKPFCYEQISSQIAVLESGVLRRLCYNHPRPAEFTIFDRVIPPEGESIHSKKRVEEKASRLRGLKGSRENVPNRTPVFKSKTVRVHWDDVKIVNGGIDCTQKVEGYSLPVHFQISNLTMRSEFDLLKPYLIKRLGKKTFSVQLDGEINEDGELITNATSDEIVQIDASFFETIKVSLVREMMSKTKEDNRYGKHLLSADELLDGTNLKDQPLEDYSIADIFAIIRNENAYRNGEQIVHLATEHNAAALAVKISLKPHFGFLFLISTKTSHNFIWELTNSNATYLWKFEVSGAIESLYEIVELEIDKIYHEGRNAYKKKKRGNQRDHTFRFDFIDHELTETGESGFAIWKESLNIFIGN